MANELLDFVDRGNFDFFKFSRAGDSTNEERDLLKSKCQHVLEYAHATVQDMCLLGFNLSELKNSKTWQDVINPESGYAFWNHSFEEFCKHAFGFSETRTSNFLRIAQFVKISGDNVDFIEPQYAKYNTSQLVELAAVYPESRKFFNPDMTVKDMRAAKNYMKMGSFYKDRTAPNFDLMQGMKAWEERKAEKESQKQDENNGQLSGQMSLENLQEVFEEDAQEKNSTSDLAEDGGEETQREKLIKDTLIKYTDYEKKRRIYNKYNQGVLPKKDFADFVKEQYGLSGHYVDDNYTHSNSKGIVMELRGRKQEVLCEIFLTWNTIAERIAKFIEDGVYLSDKTEDEKRAPVLAEVGGEDLIEDVQPVIPEPASWETEEVEEETEDEPSAVDVYAPIEQEEEQESIAEALTSRDKFRNFLNSYEDWFDVSTYFFKSYVHYWKNGAAVFAVESIAKTDMESEPTTVVRYYWRRNEEERAFEISKNEIWKYIVEHKGEL